MLAPVILVLDNRDSFTFNLVQAFQALGAEVCVRAARESTVARLEALEPAGIVVGPGPGTTMDAGCSLAAIRAFAGRVPLLGVCLGHQALALAYGGRVVPATCLLHGEAVAIEHDGSGVFAGLGSPTPMGRYNSLVVEEATLPDVLQVTARTPDGDVAGLRHRELALEGVQFHPDSLLSDAGSRLLENFLRSLPALEAAPDSPLPANPAIPVEQHLDPTPNRAPSA